MAIKDTNDNELVNFSATASAVNEITVKNAATANAPEISATGTDTNIDLKLTPKGSGNLILDGLEFPNADGSANQVLQTNGSGVLSFATPGGGKVLQVVQAVNTAITALSNTTSYTQISGFTASITPASASNKILIFSNPSTSTINSSYRLYLRLERSTTVLLEGDSSGSRVRTTMMGTENFLKSSTMIYLDSPATTSSVTYNVKYRMGPSDAHTAYLNRSGDSSDSANYATAASTWILMEIEG